MLFQVSANIIDSLLQNTTVTLVSSRSRFLHDLGYPQPRFVFGLVLFASRFLRDLVFSPT